MNRRACWQRFISPGTSLVRAHLCSTRLSRGARLQMVAEPDNPHDPSAIALFFEGKRLGYIPADHNELFAVMMHYGHADAFECVVQQVAPERSPWHQVRAAVYVADSRSSTGR